MAKARRKNLKLDSPANVRKALARIANMTINGEIDVKTANSLTATCNVILSGIRVDELESKVVQFQEFLELQNIFDDEKEN